MNALYSLKKLIIVSNPIQFYAKAKKSIYLRQLKKKDIFKWTLESWKDRGLRFGEDCIIFPSADILSEPYLVELGENVIITGSVKILTHDGSTMLFRKEDEDNGVYGRITIGNNVFIGISTIILPNVKIGNNVIIGAGSVIRGEIPDNSVVMGNPGKVIFKFEMAKRMLLLSKNYLKFKKGISEYELSQKLYEHFDVVKQKGTLR